MESNNIILQLKKDIITTMNLDMRPEDIRDDDAIFGTGLGLDSIDALELVVMLEKNYSIKLTDQEQAKKIFVSVRTLAEFIQRHK